jgi:hypothetical protein
MALDALEMAFTHDHINAFVIVGGDSDFISLVEKLKQYGRKVIVVGGRQFTSVTMQRNCHEFIAYENLVGSSGRSGRPAERGGRATSGTSDISKALPIVMRALKVLSEREVTPQLGLLKSTLLQLDSTFSEREYGAGSFRDFMEKVAEAGAVTLKQAGRSMLVEAREGGAAYAEAAPAAPEAAEPVEKHVPRPERSRQPRGERAPVERPAVLDVEEDEQLPASPFSMQDGIRAVQQAFAQAATPPRFPMYVRQAKQYLRSAIEGFDERKYGFASVVDLLRAAGKEGVLRIDRDRQGAVRVFPGANLTPKPAMPMDDGAVDVEESGDVEAPAETIDASIDVVGETVAEPPIVDGETVTDDEVNGNVAGAGGETLPRGAGRKRKTPAPRTPKAKAVKTAKPRARKSTRGKSEAADSSS